MNAHCACGRQEIPDSESDMISDKKGGMIDLLVIQVEIEVKTGERNCKLPYFRFTRITTHQKLEWQI
jgi:hypothetical protein